MLTRLSTITIDAPNQAPGTLELWWGDDATLVADRTDLLAVSDSANTADTRIGSPSLWTELVKAGFAATQTPLANFAPACDVTVLSTAMGWAGARQVLNWNPQIPGCTVAQSARYRTDSLFAAAQGFRGPKSVKLTIPLQISVSNPEASKTMLRCLVQSALTYGGWKQFGPPLPSPHLTTALLPLAVNIRIVLNTNDTAHQQEFDAIKASYEHLMDTTHPAPLPDNPGGTPFATYQGQALSVLGQIRFQNPAWNGFFWPDPITDLQAFALTLYTTSYFEIINNTLFMNLAKNMPLRDGVGYTDLDNADYKGLIPLYAALSAALMNLPAFRGGLFRGLGSLWNPFKPQTRVRELNYLSTADAIPQKAGTSTPPPWWYHPNHVFIQSCTARDISFYSSHPYEREHVFDRGMTELCTSNEPNPTKQTDSQILTIEIPKTLVDFK